jgi:ABC-type multidrug transport system fused ATPase/permease subunit
LKTAQAWDFVQQKDGVLEAEVRSGGKNFSGGQRQRLTIARALCMQGELLILDDSTSALDYATDAALRASIAALPNRPATIIVSQRTVALADADQILVLDDGKAVGLGKHEELLVSCPLYAEIHASQYAKKEGAV